MAGIGETAMMAARLPAASRRPFVAAVCVAVSASLRLAPNSLPLAQSVLPQAAAALRRY
jgi:hypothetical protein